MKIITFRLNRINGKKVVIDLQKKSYNLRRILYFIGILITCSFVLILFINSLGSKILYGSILEIILFFLALIGMIYGGYGLINTLYEQNVMICTLNNILIGNKLLFRSPFVKESGIVPKEDLQLIIVKDSKFNLFRLYLEGRKLLQLGKYTTLEEAKNERLKFRNSLTEFYPQLYISMPIYRDI
ncbi:MAG: hypothetical protein ACFFDC_04830 [Promethearchaeota archaeon]